MKELDKPAFDSTPARAVHVTAMSSALGPPPPYCSAADYTEMISCPHPPGLYPQTRMIVAPGIQGLGVLPVCVTCPTCSAYIETRTITKPSGLSHLICLGLCLIGCWVCCCLPYCTSSLDRTDHYCPNCKSLIASYRESC